LIDFRFYHNTLTSATVAQVSAIQDKMKHLGLPITSEYFSGGLFKTIGFLSSFLLAVRLRRAPFPDMIPP
jgi:hypothetical protein